MIPLGDSTLCLIHFPVMTLTIITVNFIVFFLELKGGDPFITRWSLVPAHIVAGLKG